jgi:arylsulfatase A-like enzyme
MAHHVDLVSTLTSLVEIDGVNGGDGFALFQKGSSSSFARAHVISSLITPLPESPVAVGEGCLLGESQRMVRTQRWKLVHWIQSDRYALYDLDADPLEEVDLLKAWRRKPHRAWGYEPRYGDNEVSGVFDDLIERFAPPHGASHDA